MENASKALIIVGSVLITLMIIAVGVYVFQVGQTAAGTAASSASADEVSDFNAKFSIYETPNYTSVSSNNIISDSYSLNTISDVVTAINLAYDVNYENNYGYKYDWLETDNAVEIRLKIDSLYYYLAPNENTKANMIYEISSSVFNGDSRESRVNTFKNTSESNLDGTSTNLLLSSYNDTKYYSSYTLYHYYFTCEIEYNEDTGQIDSLYFEMLSLSDWDSLKKRQKQTYF